VVLTGFDLQAIDGREMDGEIMDDGPPSITEPSSKSIR
jgi:hypothetical protein